MSWLRLQGLEREFHSFVSMETLSDTSSIDMLLALNRYLISGQTFVEVFQILQQASCLLDPLVFNGQSSELLAINGSMPRFII